MDDLIWLFLHEESHLEQEHLREQTILTPPPNVMVPLALTVNRASDRSNSSRNQGSFSGTSTTSRSSDTRCRRPQCQLCNKLGHEAVDCWQQSNQIDYPSSRPNPR